MRGPKHSHGFTIVETLIAVLMISTALIAVTSIVSRTMDVTNTTQGRLVAARLAQQGVDLVRAKRDNNILCVNSSCGNASNWDDNLVGDWLPDITTDDILNAGEGFTGGSYDTDFSGNNALICTYNDSTGSIHNGQYTYCTGMYAEPLPGGFRRVVRVEEENPGYSLRVSSKVTWGTDELIVETLLFNFED